MMAPENSTVEQKVSDGVSYHSGAERAGCGSCRDVCHKLSDSHDAQEPLAIGQVLGVFFLPLACAAGLVIGAIRTLPFLAGHPGYLALAALAVAAGAIALAGVVVHKARRPADETTENN